MLSAKANEAKNIVKRNAPALKSVKQNTVRLKYFFVIGSST